MRRDASELEHAVEQPAGEERRRVLQALSDAERRERDAPQAPIHERLAERRKHGLAVNLRRTGKRAIRIQIKRASNSDPPNCVFEWSSEKRREASPMHMTVEV